MSETIAQLLEHSGGSYTVTLELAVAQDMINVCGPRIAGGYKKARNFALDTCLPPNATDNEALGYKDFIDRYFQQRLKAARAKKKEDEATQRPFAPLAAYQDDIH